MLGLRGIPYTPNLLTAPSRTLTCAAVHQILSSAIRALRGSAVKGITVIPKKTVNVRVLGVYPSSASIQMVSLLIPRPVSATDMSVDRARTVTREPHISLGMHRRSRRAKSFQDVLVVRSI